MSGSSGASTTRGIFGFWRQIISAAVVAGLICFVLALWFPGLAPSLAARFVDGGALAFVFAFTASVSVAVHSLVVEAEPRKRDDVEDLPAQASRPATIPGDPAC